MQRSGHLEITDPRMQVASTVYERWLRFNTDRQVWLEKGAEARRYITSSTTNNTEVGSLPWKNKTTIPKLTQISDGLRSYYMAALMPTRDWFRWEGRDVVSQDRANLIEEYITTKLIQSRWRSELEKIVNDWIYYGTCYAGLSWIKDVVMKDGQEIIKYEGPRMFRVSPVDVAIDPRVSTFEKTPFFKRSVVNVIDVVDHNNTVVSGPRYDEEAVAAVRELRTGGPRRVDFIDFYKKIGLEIDGFGGIDEYVESGYVELIEYWGDVFIPDTGEIMKDRVITIADGAYVLRNDENTAWSGRKPYARAIWRPLPDNLYGQSPLDNIIGMQYRCDHLENLKADAFDQIVHPMIMIKGDMTQDFKFGPNERIHVPIDGEVSFISPDTTVLTADNQIALYHHYMEQMAGVPREMMGFRTPGEKTAFEVNVLQQGADRGFIDKVAHFEEHVVEPMLNMMFEMMVKHMTIEDVARTFNDDIDAAALFELTSTDALTSGVLKPQGARYFETRSKRIQELNTLLQIAASPTIGPHISGIQAAKMLSEELGWDKYGIVETNVAMREQILAQAEAQQLAQQVNESMGGAEGEGQPQPGQETI